MGFGRDHTSVGACNGCSYAYRYRRPGGRYFGFVIGGSLPAALVANWLAGAWDQNASMQVMSPVAAKLEEIVEGWIVDVLGLPSGSGAGFVTGTTMANFSALAAARTALLKRAGWDVEEDGLFGAPPIHAAIIMTTR